MSQNGDSPAARSAPPTSPGKVKAERPATWPVGLGVLLLVFGVLGFMQGISGLITPFTMTAFKGVPGMEHMGVMADYAWTIAGSSLVFTFLATLLGTAGVFMMRRRTPAQTLAKVWALLKLLALGGQVVMNVAMFTAMGSEMQVPVAPGVVRSFAILSAFGVFLFGAVLPVFLLFWFRRRSVQAEIASWRAEPTATAQG